MILNVIKKTISEYNLIDQNDTVLIGLSGGADSVCLTHVLGALRDELGIKLYTVHVNHGIRGEEAQRDEQYAKDFSSSLGITCFTKRCDVPAEAETSGESEETAGRRIRYEFFSKLCEKHDINKIATAHNKNDNAETILMNFMRGSAIGGLSGIPIMRGNIIRPLLNVSRKEIENYCAENHLKYMTDSTNLTDNYTRNKVRRSFIPMIQREFNPNFINTVTDNARIMRDDSDYIEKTAYNNYLNIVKDNEVSVCELLKLEMPVRRRIIRYMLKDIYNELNNVSAKYIDDILSMLDKKSGTGIDLPNGVTAKIEYEKLVIGHSKTPTMGFEYELKVNEKTFIPELGMTAQVLNAEKRENDGAVYLSYNDCDRIIVRNRRIGDRFSPSGMNGTKKVKDYFIDAKIPRRQRDLIAIIEINGEIAAVGGRVDEKYLFKNKGIRIKFEKFRR